MQLDRDLKNVLLKLAHFFQEKEIRFAVIGALVPAVLIDLCQGNTPPYGSRVTRDIDCTVQVKSWDEYDLMKKAMLSDGFEEREGEPEHRLFFKNTPVDILPFSDKLLEKEKLIWPRSKFQMNMRGFQSVFEQIESVEITKGTWVPFVSIPIAVFLKIQSFNDRKDSGDLEDIFYMLMHYEEVETSERRFDVAYQSGLDYDSSGAYLVGQDLRNRIPSKLIEDMDLFLSHFDDSESPMAVKASTLTRKPPKEIKALVSALKKGLGINP